MTGDRGVWVHAVTRALPAERLAGLSGAGGAPVRAVRADGLVAVVAEVDLDEYGETALRRNLSDLTWLESAAKAHHRVAEAVWRFGPVVPTRLATVYQDEAALRAELTRRRVDLVAVLERLEHRTEWGIKAYDVGDPPAEPEHADGPTTARTGAGTDYLRRRRVRLAASEAAQQAAAESADAVHAMLARYAEAARRHRPQDRGLSGVPDWMVLNGAYLVHAERAAAFADLVGELGTRHRALRLELTGPWPPYSFATLGAGESTW